MPILGKDGIIFMDEFAHHSIQEGVRLASTNNTVVVLLDHDDVGDLERKLKSYKCTGMKLIVVDGIYSMHGTTHDL